LFTVLAVTLLMAGAAIFVGDGTWRRMNAFMIYWLPTLIGIFMASVGFYCNGK
jgi:hypothetical protein